DRKRFIDLFAPARRLARRGAYGSADRSHGIRVERELPALFELAGGREVQIAAAVGLHGAGFLARDVFLVPGGTDLYDLVELSHSASVMLPACSGQSNANADNNVMATEVILRLNGLT